jgi:hypothetical protein
MCEDIQIYSFGGGSRILGRMFRRGRGEEGFVRVHHLGMGSELAPLLAKSLSNFSEIESGKSSIIRRR